MTCSSRIHGTRSPVWCVLLFAAALQCMTALGLSAQARATTWEGASVRMPVELQPPASEANNRLGRATGGGLLLGATLGALVGFSYGLYACAQAGEGAICLPGYLVFTGVGAAAGFVVTLVIMTGRS